MIAAAALAAVFSLALMRTAGQVPASEVQRTADGKPDLSGIWQAINTANWDLQTHAAQTARVLQPGVPHGSPVAAAPVVALGAVGGVPGGLGVVEGNEIPYQPLALAKKKDNFDNWLDRDPEIKCFFPGVPRAMYMPYPLQILQGTKKIEMVFEFANAHRTIHLDEVAPYPADAWMGHSVGRWEGDTLVVDVTSFNDATWFDRAGNFHSDALHVVERYTPISRDAIRYEATIEDPKVFTRPWKIRMPLYRRLEEGAQLFEYRCVDMAEEVLYGHLRKQPLVKRWEGKTMIVDVTRKTPPADKLYER
jgi:hypothetical protein